jgi:hypothetical protein
MISRYVNLVFVILVGIKLCFPLPEIIKIGKIFDLVLFVCLFVISDCS